MIWRSAQVRRAATGTSLPVARPLRRRPAHRGRVPRSWLATEGPCQSCSGPAGRQGQRARCSEHHPHTGQTQGDHSSVQRGAARVGYRVRCTQAARDCRRPLPGSLEGSPRWACAVGAVTPPRLGEGPGPGGFLHVPHVTRTTFHVVATVVLRPSPSYKAGVIRRRPHIRSMKHGRRGAQRMQSRSATERGADDFVAVRRSALLGHAALAGGDPHTAEDLLQEALVKLSPTWSRIADGAPEAYARRHSGPFGRTSGQAMLARRAAQGKGSRNPRPWLRRPVRRKTAFGWVGVHLPVRQRYGCPAVPSYFDLPEGQITECLNCAPGDRLVTRLTGHGDVAAADRPHRGGGVGVSGALTGIATVCRPEVLGTCGSGRVARWPAQGAQGVIPSRGAWITSLPGRPQPGAAIPAATVHRTCG